MPDLPSRFGPYEIVSPLGAGGMGQVYRARDSRLNRSVAIKILREPSALNPDRQRRFAQEAIAASALNHPNILTVYDVGVEGDIPYLVSELIDGGSLREEMNRGRIPLRRAIEIAHQIADGLTAAHEAGIVHRDLKPENVMVNVDGRVKIVDFGLAKARDDEELLVGGATGTQTAAGLIVGTLPYMSPEQARGDKAHFRSDQFALGVMLYEMTTAAHPFKRDTAVQTLSAIIADEPPDPAQLNPMLPVAVRWLIRRLLAKNPRERFAHTADVAADLRMIREYLAEATSTVTTPVVAPRLKWPVRVAVVALAAASVFILGRAFGAEESSVHFDRFTPFATDAGYQGGPAWSPDGKSVAYEAEINGVVQIFTRKLGSPMRTQVTTSAFDCYSPFWSPDGSHIYYHSLAREKDALWQVSPAGGAPRMVMEGATRSAISPDGQTLAVLREESTVDVSMSLWVASPPDSEPHRYARGALKDMTFSNGQLRFSPDGSRLMAWLWRDADTVGPQSGFWEIQMPGGEPRAVLSSLIGLRVPPLFSWLPDSRHIVAVRSDGPTPGTHLWVADTSNDTLRPLTATSGNEGAPSVSPDGRTIAFASEATDFDLVEVPLDGSPLRPFLSSTRNEFDPAASPVNTQYAFVTDRTGSLQIWLQNEEGYLQQPLVTDGDFGGMSPMAVGSLAFSPDGKRLAFQRFDAASEKAFGGPRLWISSVSGGTPVPLGGEGGYQDAPTWSPDGEWIAFIKGRIGEWSLAKARVGGGTAPVTLKSGIPPFVARPQWSPDGQWIVCETSEGLTIISSTGTSSRVISDPGWLAYGWAADGRRIYGLRPTDDQHHFLLVSTDVQTGAERVINSNLGTIPPANQPIRGFSRLRGRGFLTSIARVRSDIFLIEGFRLPASWRERFWPFGSARRR
jgi:eukaryotic-like serine/threonine-protein kinase